jgi:hypothetical protein
MHTRENLPNEYRKKRSVATIDDWYLKKFYNPDYFLNTKRGQAAKANFTQK